jgi:hypothetical protein
MQQAERSGGKMQEDLNKKTDSLEDNLPMVNYIMLHRIYDMMSLIAKGLVGQEEATKMIQYHEQGYLLGPAPAYTPEEND